MVKKKYDVVVLLYCYILHMMLQLVNRFIGCFQVLLLPTVEDWMIANIQIKIQQITVLYNLVLKTHKYINVKHTNIHLFQSHHSKKNKKLNNCTS